MDANVAVLEVAVGAGIAFLIIGTLEWLERLAAQPKVGQNRRMSTTSGNEGERNDLPTV